MVLTSTKLSSVTIHLWANLTLQANFSSTWTPSLTKARKVITTISSPWCRIGQPCNNRCKIIPLKVKHPNSWWVRCTVNLWCAKALFLRTNLKLNQTIPEIWSEWTPRLSMGMIHKRSSRSLWACNPTAKTPSKCPILECSLELHTCSKPKMVKNSQFNKTPDRMEMDNPSSCSTLRLFRLLWTMGKPKMAKKANPIKLIQTYLNQIMMLTVQLKNNKMNIVKLKTIENRAQLQIKIFSTAQSKPSPMQRPKSNHNLPH